MLCLCQEKLVKINDEFSSYIASFLYTHRISQYIQADKNHGKRHIIEALTILKAFFKNNIIISANNQTKNA